MEEEEATTTRQGPRWKVKPKKRPPGQGGGDLLVDILTFPVLGAPKMVGWVGRKMSEEVEHQEFDEGAVQGQLLDLQMRYEVGEIDDNEYAEGETALLDRLSYIRKAKEKD